MRSSCTIRRNRPEGIATKSGIVESLPKHAPACPTGRIGPDCFRGTDAENSRESLARRTEMTHKTQLRTEINGDHAEITFSTDGAHNVLSPDVLHSFGAAVARVKMDPRLRTTVVRATGKVFLAGADVRTVANYTPEQAREYSAMGRAVFDDLAALPSLTVAAINGAALAGGLEVALACDFRIAVKSAKLGLPEVTLGLIPGWGGINRLTKLVGPSRAKKLYLGGMPVSAEEGFSFGLVDELVNSAEDLQPRVAAFLRSFRLAAPSALRLAKRASRDFDELSAFADCFRTTECREGITAFLENRPASWMDQDNS